MKGKRNIYYGGRGKIRGRVFSGTSLKTCAWLFAVLLVVALFCSTAAFADFGSWADASDNQSHAWGPKNLPFSGDGQYDGHWWESWDYDWIKFDLSTTSVVTFKLTKKKNTSYIKVDGVFDWQKATTTQTYTLDPGTYYVCVASERKFHPRTKYSLSITASPTTACYLDSDGDGYGDPSDVIYGSTCPSGRVDNDDDCDDSDPAKWSGATDICDGIDNDCDGTIDEDCSSKTYYKDADGDGYGNPSISASGPPAPTGFVDNDQDCDDGNAAVHPGATEVCNGIDDNCDGNIDDLTAWYYPDDDGDGYGAPVGEELSACDAHPGYVTNNQDCDDGNASVHPGASEVCNGIDDDCDGSVDEGLATQTYYYDYDGDGWGISSSTKTGCAPPAGYVAPRDADGDGTYDFDCNDNDASIHPGAFDSCDTPIDENCSGDNSDCSEEPAGCANLANYPLETNVVSAPPLIEFLFDDSGSMKWEVMFSGNYNGLFEYYYSSWWGSLYTDKVYYVFETGSSTDRDFYPTQCYQDNGLYYNPDINYVPWPGHADADPDNPKLSPTSSTTVDMDGNFLDGIINAHYYVEDGSDVYLVELRSSGVKYYTVDYETGTTYWGRINNVTETSSPPASIQITRTLADERQNFANWLQYYRTRQNTAKAAVLQVINGLSGVKVGLHTINHNNNIDIAHVGMLSVDSSKSTLLNFVEDIGANGGTPLRSGLKNVGDFFEGNYGSVDSPYASAADGGECQQAFCIVMTDGYYNGSLSSGVGNADGDNNTDFDGPPFADGNSNTLADIAMYFYERDLRTDLADHVPENDYDSATHQHMVTYSLSLGVIGTIDPDNYPDCPSGTCPTWTTPSSDAPENIDDLYHAAINGRGRFVPTSNPVQLVQTLNDYIADITARRGSAASVAVSTQSLKENTKLFQGSYDSAGWKGDLRAYSIDYLTGEVDQNYVWSAAEVLDALTDSQAISRNIFTYNGSSGVAFAYANLTSDQLDQLGANEAEQRGIIDFIKGDRSNEKSNGGSYRSRGSRLGDIVHSAPVHVDNTIYVGANDGMLHAFNASTGEEQFAYIPSFMYSYRKLYGLANPNYTHKYYVDATPFVRDGKLVCGLGKGGKGYFALDVSDPANFDASDVLWEFPETTDDDLGYTFSKAVFVNSGCCGKIVIFGNGYSSKNQEAVLYVIDVDDADFSYSSSDVVKIHTGVGSVSSGICNGLSTPTVIDTDFDGNVDLVYAGDLQGDLWKFDLSGAKSDWKVALTDSGGNPVPLFCAKDESGKAQPITTKPSVAKSCEGPGYIVAFGTGSFIATGDFTDTSPQAFYGVWDWADAWEQAADTLGITLTASQISQLHYGYLMPPSGGVRLLSAIEANPMFDSPEAHLTMLKQEEDVVSGGYRSTTDNPIDWFSPYLWLKAEEAGTPYTKGLDVGWYLEFPAGSKERVISDPQIRGSEDNVRVIFMSMTPSDAVCDTGGGTSIFNVLDLCSGGVPEDQYWSTDDPPTIDDVTGKELGDIYYKPPILSPPDDPGYTGPDGQDIAYPDPGEDPIYVESETTGKAYWMFVK